MNKINMYLLSGFLLSIAVYITFIENLNFEFIGTIISASSIFVIVQLFEKRKYLNFLFSVLVMEIYMVMTVRIFILDLPENVWRVVYNSYTLNQITFRYFSISIALILLIQTLICLLDRTSELNKFSYERTEFIGSFRTTIFDIGMILFLVYALVIKRVLFIRDYSNISDTSTIALLLIIFSFYAVFVVNSIKTRRIKYYRYVLSLIVMSFYLITLLILSMQGYRYILVQIVFLALFIYLINSTKVKFSTLIKLGCLFIVLYILLIFVKITYLGDTEFASMLFAHERNLYYSFNAILANTSYLDNNENTYISSLLNLLPRTITHSHHMNSSALLMQYINAQAYNTTGITYGTFYIVEAYFNYKFIGIIIVSIFFPTIFGILDKQAQKYSNSFYIFIYTFIGSQMFNIVYYGSLNYLKAIFYYILFICLMKIFKIIKIQAH